MQTQRGGLSPLTVPTMPHRRSSLLSINSAASPRTPRSCRSPSLYYPAHRKSTDSWNSSNADDMDVEWKQEHVLLLSRTLDALPAHLVTPFNGPVPPSNLLDKIARGVSEAKGPLDWPYSIRATRVKLLELARAHAKEEAVAEKRRHHAIEEEIEIDDGSSYSYFHEGEDKPITGVGIGPRRPLYRQSSMDFIRPGPADVKDNANIARLSNRLQHTDRVFPNPSYHPYSRIPRLQQMNRRSSSPPHPTDVPALISPSTPSSTTVNSLSSLSSGLPMLRRSASSVSSGSLLSASSSGMPLTDPRIQRIRRSDSFCSSTPPPPPPKDLPSSKIGLKRAPSYGALAQEARQEAIATDRVHGRQLSGSYPSSDEEEKARTRHAKKLRTKTGIAQSPPASPLKQSSASSALLSPPSSPTTPQPKVAKGPGALPVKVRGGSPGTAAPSNPNHVRAGSTLGNSSLDGSSSVKPGGHPSRKEGVDSAQRSRKKSSSAAVVGLGLGLPSAGLGPDVDMDKKAEAKNRNVQTKVSNKTAETSKIGKTHTEKDKAHREREKCKNIDVDKTGEVMKKKLLPMNLQRNPSMFGAELPCLKSQNSENNTAHSGTNNHEYNSGVLSAAPVLMPAAVTKTRMQSPSAKLALSPLSPSLTLSPGVSSVSRKKTALSPSANIFNSSRSPSPSPYSPCLPPPLSPSPSSPTTQRVRTLRRVRRLAPTAPGRRISFNSLKAPEHARGSSTSGDDADMECDEEAEPMLLASPVGRKSKGLGTSLGSAFQLL